MANPGSEPIERDEILLRRVYEPYYKSSSGYCSKTTFEPTRSDLRGISMSREKYRTPMEEAAAGVMGKNYHVARLRAGTLFDRGIRVEPRPVPDNVGRVELPDLAFEKPLGIRVKELARWLSENHLAILGPYEGRRAK